MKVKLKLPKPGFKSKSTKEVEPANEQHSAGGKLLPLAMSPVIAKMGSLPKKLVGRRSNYLIIAAATLFAILMLVPFETFVGDVESVIRIHIALASVAISLVAWRFLAAVKKELHSENLPLKNTEEEATEQKADAEIENIQDPQEQQKNDEYIVIKHSCGHSGKISKALVEGWMRQKSIPTFDLSTGIIELTVICQHCQEAVKQQAGAADAQKPAAEMPSPAVAAIDKPKSGKKKKLMMIAAGAAAIIVVVGVFGSGSSSPVSGLMDPIKEKVCGMVSSLNPSSMLPGMPSMPDMSGSLPSEMPEGLPPGMTQLPDTSGGLSSMSGEMSGLASFCGTG